MSPFNSEKIITNIIPKKKDATSMAIAFPNTYSIGMASLGYQTAWKLFNQNENLTAARWFIDIQEGMGRPYAPTYIGFSFSWELDYKNIFAMLEKNNIPLYSKDRTETDPLVFCGGQVPNANPESFCDFFDFFLLGDLEVTAENLINKIVEIKDLKREEKLNELAKLPGVYVPRCKDLPWQVSTKKLTTKSDLTSSAILTPNCVWPNTFIVEVVRSCPELCRFCLASYGSLPFRAPDIKDNLIPIIDFGLKHTSKIGLLGASVTQHPGFEDLLNHLLTKKSSVQVQIASVRADSISKNISDGLHKLGAKSLTMAVETGSQRLRDIINKKVSNETIINSIQTIYNSGFNSIKLYGMVGLPHETIDDLKETMAFLKEIKQKNKGKKLIWGCSVFVPKAGTPFQWYGVSPDAEEKLKFLEKELHKVGVEFRGESYNWATIQALISRGDQKLGKVLELAYRYGNTLGSFKKAMKECKKEINCDDYIFKNWDTNLKLPWERGNTQGFLNKNIIKGHYEKALAITV